MSVKVHVLVFSMRFKAWRQKCHACITQVVEVPGVRLQFAGGGPACSECHRAGLSHSTYWIVEHQTRSLSCKLESVSLSDEGSCLMLFVLTSNVS